MVVYVVNEIRKDGLVNWTGVHENMGIAILQFNHIIQEQGTSWAIQNPGQANNHQVMMYATSSAGWVVSISKVVLE